MRKTNATRRTNYNRYKGRTGQSGTYRTSGGTWAQSFHGATGNRKDYGYKTTGGQSYAGVAKGYNQVCCTFENRFKYYRMLWEQTRGTCKGDRPSPATLKTFANWINKGANIYKVTNAQINKWCHTQQTFKTCTSAKTALCNKFGKATIKAIAPCKTGGFLVATAPTWHGKPFKFPY